MTMTKKSQKILAIIMLSLLMLGSFMYLKPKAGTTAADALKNLADQEFTGQYIIQSSISAGGKTSDGKKVGCPGTNPAETTFKTDGGGFLLWKEIVTKDENSFINEGQFDQLKSGEKQKLLKYMMQIGNGMAYDTANGNTAGKSVTTDTVNDMCEILQNKTGVGSQLLASLLSETKPDFAAANKIYEPFSGVVGTILGVISVVMMALLGLTMALDIAFIVIPAFQLIMGGDEGSGKEGNKFSKLISVEARNAVNAAEGGGGAGGQDGSGHKMALGIYFKARWKGLVILGICLLYLVQGQIYSFVAWVIDLLSGFLGF